MLVLRKLPTFKCFLLPKFNLILHQRLFCQINLNQDLIKYFESTFDVPTFKVKSMMLQFPTIRNISEEQVDSAIQTLANFGIGKDCLLKNPKIFNIHFFTLKMRLFVLMECGFTNIDLPTLSKYITFINKRTLAELRKSSILPNDIQIWDELVKCFHAYPDIQNKLTSTTCYDAKTLCQIRVEIIQKFLELKYNLSKVSFEQIIKTYPAIKHRSLKTICESLQLVENELMFPIEKILDNGFIFETNPENIRKLISDVKDIGGIDIKHFFIKCPLLLKTNYKSILKMKQIFKMEGISEEAQRKSPEIFTLSAETVHERIRDFKEQNLFKGFFDNPRILKLVYYKNRISKRISNLHSVNKSCSSLHKLISNRRDFDRIMQSFGDKTKGIDVVRTLVKYAPSNYNTDLIKNLVTRHPYWTHVPLHVIVANMEYLEQSFDIYDIFENFHILLYPLEYIKTDIDLLNSLKYDEMNSIIKFKKLEDGKVVPKKYINAQIKHKDLSASQFHLLAFKDQMALVCRPLSFARFHVFKIICRHLKQKSINEKVLQCFQEAFDVSTSQIFPILIKYPRLNVLKQEQILESLDVLKTFNIDKIYALENPVVFSTRPHILNNRGNVLLECGFREITANYLIKYHSLIKKSTIEELKNDRLLPHDLNVYDNLWNCFTTIPHSQRFEGNYHGNNSLHDVRLMVMQKYLKYKLNIDEREFLKMYNTYFHFQHRPLVDIEKSLLIATDEIKIPIMKILSYPYVVAVDPVNTRKILDDGNSFNGIDAGEMLSMVPGILRSSYSNILKITQILKKYKFPPSTVRKAGFLYTFKSETIEERLSNIKENKIFNSLYSNPRFLVLIVRKKKAERRIHLIKKLNRKCVSLSSLVTSNDIFDRQIKELTDKNCSLDILHLFVELLIKSCTSSERVPAQSHKIKKMIYRHYHYLYVPTVSIYETIILLKKHFSTEEILENCHLVFYSAETIEKYLMSIVHLKNMSASDSSAIDLNQNDKICDENLAKVSSDLQNLNLNFNMLNNTHILGLVLYLMEKDQFFSGEGIWNNSMLASKE
ncbi:uncharacterized protein LOC143913720 [Arctopsyche grandis]|uniref:uncharacterized protein LOC143913720 n=1 Tax=Arctopsyche grandis TaxID=121162 RepID=UPI00406D7AEC